MIRDRLEEWDETESSLVGFDWSSCRTSLIPESMGEVAPELRRVVDGLVSLVANAERFRDDGSLVTLGIVMEMCHWQRIKKNRN